MFGAFIQSKRAIVCYVKKRKCSDGAVVVRLFVALVSVFFIFFSFCFIHREQFQKWLMLSTTFFLVRFDLLIRN